jgi:hypothetical protein
MSVPKNRIRSTLHTSLSAHCRAKTSVIPTKNSFPCYVAVYALQNKRITHAETLCLEALATCDLHLQHRNKDIDVGLIFVFNCFLHCSRRNSLYMLRQPCNCCISGFFQVNIPPFQLRLHFVAGPV